MQQRQRTCLRLPAPTLGEHSISVLKNIFAYTDAMINQLEQEEVIGQRPKGL